MPGQFRQVAGSVARNDVAAANARCCGGFFTTHGNKGATTTPFDGPDEQVDARRGNARAVRCRIAARDVDPFEITVEGSSFGRRYQAVFALAEHRPESRERTRVGEAH